MENTPHYLRLAYLAETAIVFNLAYIELKWIKEYGELVKQTPDDSFSPNVRDDQKSSQYNPVKSNACDTQNCVKCQNNAFMDEKFESVNRDYILKALETMKHEIGKNDLDLKALRKAWSWSDGKYGSWFFYWTFHVIAHKKFDLLISKLSLGLASILLIIATMVDCKLDFWGSLLFKLGLFGHHHQIYIAFLLFLSISLIIPGLFWLFWKTFLKRYECLCHLAINAFQYLSKREVTQQIKNFPK